jgi:hypothetical protein
MSSITDMDWTCNSKSSTMLTSGPKAEQSKRSKSILLFEGGKIGVISMLGVIVEV